jgi:hypothetical protein
MKNHRTTLTAATLAAVLTLSGCWDDNNDTETAAQPPVDATEVPDSAGVSIGAFSSFILGLAAGDEKSEPLTIKASFAVPADEAAEPTPLP